MLSPAPLVFLLDVDNTLLDNDRFTAELSARLEQDFGRAGREAYWALYEAQRTVSGYADYLGSLQAFRAGREDAPELMQLSEFLLEYPFADCLYPQALEVIAHLAEYGLPVLLSEGDAVFQPRKLQRSGLWAAVAGRVMIPLRKLQALELVQRRYPAQHYVMVEDKPQLLAAIKQQMGKRLTTVFVRQGHHALAAADPPPAPAPDRVMERIAQLIEINPMYWRSLGAAEPA